jgi:hypothetical protein
MILATLSISCTRNSCSKFKVRGSRILSFEGSLAMGKGSFTSFRTGLERGTLNLELKNAGGTYNDG